MGRTNPTFTMLIREHEGHWQKFRRALRKEDQEILDDLFTAPKIHLAACFYAINPIPFENIIMTMLLEERKKTIHLEKKFNTLNNKVEELIKFNGISS